MRIQSIGQRTATKLKDRARAKGMDAMQLLQRYVQERICTRLWAFEEGNNLSLKGGAAYYFTPEFVDLNRPTADVDVHTHVVMAHEEVMEFFQKALDLDDEDGLTFELGKTSTLKHEHGEHQGLRIHIVAVMGATRVQTYADVGIGGEPPVGMREIRIKPMIEGQSTNTFRVQPFAYSAAEKLHAIVDKGLKNTRMKDYRDLLVLARKGFDEETVRNAIEHTFRQRATELPDGAPVGLTQAFVDIAQADWARYLENNRIEGMPEDFGDVVAELDAYYTPLMQREQSYSLRMFA